MPWNGSGTFNRIYSWVADKAAGLDISSTRMDTDTNDIASQGFGNCLTRDGQGQPTANLPMNNFKHTGVAGGNARTDYPSFGQAQDGLIGWTIAGGTSDVITATYTPAHPALVDGLLFSFRASAASLTTTPTFNPDGLGARTVTRPGGSPLAVNDISGEQLVRYNAGDNTFHLLNPSNGSLFNAVATTGTVAATIETTAPTGWLMLNDTTMGSAASGAASASDLNQALFTLLFNNISDSNCPILTSTGGATTRAGQGTAAAAWSANCRMTLPKMLGRALASAGAGGGLTSRALGATAGEETHLLTLGETPTGITATGSGSASVSMTGGLSLPAVTGGWTGLGAGTGGFQAVQYNGVQTPQNITTISGTATGITTTSNNTGGGAHNNMQPTSFLNFKIKQ